MQITHLLKWKIQQQKNKIEMIISNHLEMVVADLLY